MDDNIDVDPSTLQTCEKYHYKEDIWTPVSPLNVPRAYAGVVTFPGKFMSNKLSYIKGVKKITEALVPSNQYIYVFAGLNDFIVLDTIEKYDVMCDMWTQLQLK